MTITQLIKIFDDLTPEQKHWIDEVDVKADPIEAVTRVIQANENSIKKKNARPSAFGEVNFEFLTVVK